MSEIMMKATKVHRLLFCHINQLFTYNAQRKKELKFFIKKKIKGKNNLHGVQVHYVKFCLLLDCFSHVLNCKLHLQSEPNINELLIHGKIVGQLLSILIREKPGPRQAICI